MNHQPMKSMKLMVSMVAILALVAFLASSVSAFASIDRVTVNGIESFGNGTAAVFAGETVPVRVIFTATGDETDVRVMARVIGESGISEVSERFDVLTNNTYSRLLNIKMPFDIDPSEDLVLVVTVESNARLASERRIDLEVQRESYLVEILSVDSVDQLKAGQTLALDVVLKNRGRQMAEDTYVRATIPELGVSNTAYFSDLTAEDQSHPDKEDAVERRMYLNIPQNAAPGVYTIELEAYNSDSSSVRTKRIVVVGAGAESRVLSPSTSKSFAADEEKVYSITIVNSGDEIKVYDLVIKTSKGLTVEADDGLVVVPAGSSKTVQLTASASEEGDYTFDVTISSDGELVKQESFAATVEGSAQKVNASVVLTVVLAVIFVVLVIVLIVLLTRKPQKSEEFGESYY
ncbi:MAG: hypothetical protein AABX53_03260 [Nanoarchaeota archaeon]